MITKSKIVANAQITSKTEKKSRLGGTKNHDSGRDKNIYSTINKTIKDYK
jgi:hypothetical protein